MNLYVTLEAPWQWATVNAKGAVLDSGTSPDLQSVPRPSSVSRVIGVAPGGSVTTRAVMVPGNRRSNVEAALPYALEDSLSEDVDLLHFSMLDWQPGKAATTAIVNKDQLRSWINDTAEAGLKLDSVVPGYLLMPFHKEGAYTIGLIEGEQVYVRSGPLTGFTMDQSFFDYWLETEQLDDIELCLNDQGFARQLSEQQVENIRFWDIGKHIGQWLKLTQDTKLVEQASLLHGEFLPFHRSSNWRPLKVALVCGLVAVGVQFISMSKQVSDLESQSSTLNTDIRQLFSQKFPGEPYLGRPRFQVESLLAGESGDASIQSFQQLLGQAVAVLNKHGAEIEELNFRENSLTLLCNVSSLSLLDQIQSDLQAQSGITADLMSSGSRDNQVTGRFRVTGG